MADTARAGAAAPGTLPHPLLGEVPAHWTRTTLGEVCEPDGGIRTGPFGTMLHASDYLRGPDAGRGVPSVMPANIGDNRVVEDGIARVAEADAERLGPYRLREGDIVYARRGDVERRALVRPPQEGWLCGTGCLRVRPGPAAEPGFLAYYLGHPAVRAWLVRHAVGATMPHLNVRTLARVPLALPPRAEQAAIAGRLAALDAKTEINDTISRTYEALLRADWAALGADAPGGDGLIRADELVEFNPPLARPPGTDVPYVDMAALPTAAARVTARPARRAAAGARFRNGDVLFARITPCLENGKTAFVDFLADGETGTGSTEFIVLRARPGVPQAVAYLLARSPRFRQFAISAMAGSSGRQRCPAGALAGYLLRRPEPAALAALGVRTAGALAHVKALDEESARLTALRDALLPRLLTGRPVARD
ncbi:restriction endonuclease subunit S [Streptomyces sp. NPDC050560]|uniref:restriction endonuclease subunit S n=1 Tax=Streptomyces sp. NPDC050560 TaxID=3365630 RepID=UPI00379F11A1